MIVALSGGVGGAKLVSGLVGHLGEAAVVAVVNTGDDFDYLGLRICPDLDSVLYALAGLNDEQRGWGRRDETWRFQESLRQLGADPWFQLGDSDLAVHVLRTDGLRRGLGLAEVTARLVQGLGLGVRLLPMSDDPVATVVATPLGDLPFQDYFVRRRCEPVCLGVRFEGAAVAKEPAALAALAREGSLSGIVICPSNPIVSIDPILGIGGIRRLLEERRCPAVAVSPIVGGAALKGPAAKMMSELGMEASALGVARHYAGLVDGMVIDVRDAAEASAIRALGLAVQVTDTIMVDDDARRRLAGAACDLLASIGGVAGNVLR